VSVPIGIPNNNITVIKIKFSLQKDTPMFFSDQKGKKRLQKTISIAELY
jgi:hypothetical protein